jgi:hypothetical protein
MSIHVAGIRETDACSRVAFAQVYRAARITGFGASAGWTTETDDYLLGCDGHFMLSFCGATIEHLVSRGAAVRGYSRDVILKHLRIIVRHALVVNEGSAAKRTNRARILCRHLEHVRNILDEHDAVRAKFDLLIWFFMDDYSVVPITSALPDD